MRQLSKTFANFADAGMGILPALPSAFGGRHRGRQTDFYPSENLENSLERGKRLKAVPPVECIDDCITIHAAHIHPCRCELFFSFFLSQVFQNLQTRNVRRLTPRWRCINNTITE